MSVTNTLGYNGYPLPVGTIFPYIGQTIPNAIESGTIVCDGASYSPTEWKDLFAAIGYAYGRDGDNFRVPALSTLDNSFITGALVTNPTRTNAFVDLEAPAGRKLTAANIPTLSSKADALAAFDLTTNIIATQGSQNQKTITTGDRSALAVNTGTPAITGITFSDVTYNNAVPADLPDTDYNVTGDFNPEYVSVIYLIKARYALPPLVGASTPNTPPPTSNIYNQNKQIGGFTDFGGAIQFAYY